MHHLPNPRPLGPISSCRLDNLHRDRCAILGVNRLCCGCQTITTSSPPRDCCCCQLHHHLRLRLQHHHSAWKDPRRHPMTLPHPPTSLLTLPTALSPPSMTACPRACCVRLEWCFLRLVVVLCVCVFFPIYSGRQNRWKHQPGFLLGINFILFIRRKKIPGTGIRTHVQTLTQKVTNQMSYRGKKMKEK